MLWPDESHRSLARAEALADHKIGPNADRLFIDGFLGGTCRPRIDREIRIKSESVCGGKRSASVGLISSPAGYMTSSAGSASLNFNDESLNSPKSFPDQFKQAVRLSRFANFGGKLQRASEERKGSFSWSSMQNEPTITSWSGPNSGSVL